MFKQVCDVGFVSPDRLRRVCSSISPTHESTRATGLGRGSIENRSLRVVSMVVGLSLLLVDLDVVDMQKKGRRVPLCLHLNPNDQKSEEQPEQVLGVCSLCVVGQDLINCRVIGQETDSGYAGWRQ